MKGYSCFLFAWSFIFYGCKLPQPTENNSTTIHYELVKNWPQLPQGFVLGNPSGIGIDKDENIFVFHRAGRKWPLLLPMPKSFITANTILLLDRNTGRLLKSWGANLFIMPHGLTVDNDNNVWVTDVGLQQVFKFSHDGKLVMKLGEATVAGNDSAHFNRPTDVAVAPDGSFYVSDGYRNSRVVKFSASGHFLFQWGQKGKGSGAFNIPHSIALDNKGNVYVADRENKRVQVFDSAGRFLHEWKSRHLEKVYAVAFDKMANHLVAVDYATRWLFPAGSDVMGIDSTAKVLFRFGRSGLYNGPVCRYHDVAVDKEGNIYVGDILTNSIQKFKKAVR